MRDLLHHLSALGFGWVAVFLVLDGVAIACAVVALRGEERRLALRALAVSSGVTFLTLCTTAVAFVFGIASANAAVAAPGNPSNKAKELAEGISVATNGAAFGAFFTVIAGIATIVCAVSAASYRTKPSPDSARRGS